MTNHLKITLALLTCLLLCTNCVLEQGIKGSGNVIKEKREAKPFTQIKIDGVFNIYLTQGETEHIEVEADDNLLEYIKTDINNGILSIDTEQKLRIKKSHKSNVYITLKDISVIDFGGVGNIYCSSELILNTLQINNSGVGSIKLKGKAKEVSMINSGVGNIKATEFEVEYLDVKATGVGSIKVNATKELNASITGVGSVYYTGNPQSQHVDIDGIGKFKKIN